MSWSDLARVCAALGLAGGLSGCFEPLYGEAAHPGLVDDVRAIEVTPIKERVGHYLTDDLIANLNGSGSSPPPKYKLNVAVALKSQTPTVESQVNAADSATVVGDATYTLTKIGEEKPVLSGAATSAAAYDRTAQRYADLRAARDAEIRIARALAAEIALRVSAGLAAQH